VTVSPTAPSRRASIVGMAPGARFAVRFDPVYRRLSAALLLPPADAWVTVSGEEVEVRMAWAFRARFPRASRRRSAAGCSASRCACASCG
jgi:hypothetical protein